MVQVYHRLELVVQPAWNLIKKITEKIHIWKIYWIFFVFDQTYSLFFEIKCRNLSKRKIVFTFFQNILAYIGNSCKIIGFSMNELVFTGTVSNIFLKSQWSAKKFEMWQNDKIVSKVNEVTKYLKNQLVIKYWKSKWNGKIGVMSIKWQNARKVNEVTKYLKNHWSDKMFEKSAEDKMLWQIIMKFQRSDINFLSDFKSVLGSSNPH